MEKVLSLVEKRRALLARGLDSADDATAALYDAARALMRAGHSRVASEYLALCELAVEVRRELPDRAPAA